MSEDKPLKVYYSFPHAGFPKIESRVKAPCHPSSLGSDKWYFRPMEDIPACPDSTVLFPEKDNND